VRRTYARQVDLSRRCIAEHFPRGTRISQPAGGFVLWVQLPEPCDGDQLFRRALERKVSITPGSPFSATRRFGQYIRISAGQPWTDQIKQGIATVGELAKSVI
jgi:DNA-binding transcriptional MocR family regulator